MKRSTKTILLISICLISFGIVLSSIGYFTGANPAQIFRSGLWNTFYYSDRHFSSAYNDSGIYTVSADMIDSVEVDWVSGSIDIKPYDGNEIRFTETSNQGIIESNALKYEIEDNTLNIYFSENNRWNNASLQVSDDIDKALTIEIPQSMLTRFNDLAIECVSSDVTINDLVLNDLDVNSVSANVTGNNVTVNQTDLNFVSGNLDIEFLKCPAEFAFDSVSGNAVMYLPENSGLTVEISTGQGHFISDFPVTGTDDDSYIIGDGRSEFEVFGLQGQLSIKKGSRP